MNLRDKLHDQIDKMTIPEIELFDAILEQRRRTLEARVPRHPDEVIEFKRLLNQLTEAHLSVPREQGEPS
jgi:hypothetical protein